MTLNEWQKLGFEKDQLVTVPAIEFEKWLSGEITNEEFKVELKKTEKKHYPLEPK